MLSLWNCQYCGLNNYPQNEQCQACFNDATQLSPLDQIKYKQRITAEGYLKLETSCNNLTPVDIINLCIKFYEIDIKSPSTANELKSLIWEFMNNKEYYMACEIGKLSITFYPNNANYHAYYGNALAYWNLPDAAEMEYLSIVELHPESGDSWYTYGLMLQINRKYELALMQIKRAIEIEPSNAKYILACATVYENLKDYMKAANLFTKAIEIDPKDMNSYYEYATMLRDKVRDYPESERYYLKALEINDVSDRGTNGSYGYLLYLMGEYNKGIKYVEIELALHPRKYWAHFYHGLLHKVLGNKELSEKALLKAIEFAPGNKEGILVHLEVLKKNDSMNLEYYERFEKQIKSH